MGIALKRFPEFRLDLNLYSGAVSDIELLRHLGNLDSAANWLSYFDATADLSGIDLAHFPTLKQAVTAKEYERADDEPRRHALVNISPANELFVRFWRSYVTSGVRIAHTRAIFPTLDAACRWLALPRDARETVAVAVAAASPVPGTPASADHAASTFDVGRP